MSIEVSNLYLSDVVYLTSQTSSSYEIEQLSGEIARKLDKRIGGKVSGDVELIQSNLCVLSGSIIQNEGQFIGGKHSIAVNNSFAYGTACSALGENSYAVGISTVAGCYGWYYVSLSTDAKLFYLSAVQPQQTETPRGPAEFDQDFESGLNIGDVVSFVNFNKYDIGSTVVGISGNAISVDNLPAGSGDTHSLLPIRSKPDHDDWCLFCPAKPLVGGVWLGDAAYSTGVNNKAINAYSYADGKDNVAYGQYSHVEGRDNQAGYASHAEGRGVRVHGQYSHGEGLSTEVVTSVNTCAHVEGRQTKALDRYSHAEGYLTEAKYCCHAEGLSSKAHGDYSHAEGENSYAFGNYSHTEGYNTQAQNQSEHAQGQFNKSNVGTLHSIGNGTSKTNRKNVVEIMQNGKVYVKGIGNYDGTNPTAAGVKDLAAILETNGFIQCMINAVQQMDETQKNALKAALGI